MDMMRLASTLAALLVAAAMAPAEADAQGRSGDAGRAQQQQARTQGPPFCANGQGHPVHGREWCRQKGWATGTRWERAPWDDVVLRNPRRAERQSVGGATLGDILGDVVFGRVDAQRRALGVREPLAGRWTQENGLHILRVHAGGVPVAEFVDRTGNGRVELVRVNRGR
jgi:hypothetical protein